MIGYLSGKLVWHNHEGVILNVRGVGYEVIFASNNANLLDGEDLSLFICRKVSEYGEALYGFQTYEEKYIFEVLDNIKGVGARAIYTIMSSLEIHSVGQLNDLKLEGLVKLPGIGKSTAQKFLLGLSSKLKKDFDLDSLKEVSRISTSYEGEIALMVEWGMKKSDVVKLINDNVDSLKGKNSEEVIKFLLQNK